MNRKITNRKNNSCFPWAFTCHKTDNKYKAVTLAAKLSATFGSVLFVSSCTVIGPPEAYPPAKRPAPSTQQPQVINKPTRSTPAPSKPAKQPVKPVKVPVKVDKPEQGDNPYDTVPKERPSSNKVTTPVAAVAKPIPKSSAPTSAAVKSLLQQAKVDSLAKQNGAAVTKLERALRIEPQNAEVWHALAKVHFDDRKYSSTITMAKKSNLYALEGSSLEKQNWKLIKAASKQSGNIKALKDAIRYERANP